MRKSLVSPLCSAFVIPGLGQILNQHLKKGICILAAAFILFIAGAIKFYTMMNSAFKGLDINATNSKIIMERLDAENTSVIWLLLVIFSILWLYSVLDAFISGMKIDQSGKNNQI